MRNAAKAVILLFTLLAAPSAFAKHKDDAPAPCSVYFTITEQDQFTGGQPVGGFNKPQQDWYEKHGDRDKTAGICWVPDVSKVPAGAALYLIVWSETTSSYSTPGYTYESGTQTTNTPVETNNGQQIGTLTQTTPTYTTIPGQSGTGYFASGRLLVWDSARDGGKGNYVAVSAVDGRGIGSRATLLLKHALEEINKRGPVIQ